MTLFADIPSKDNYPEAIPFSALSWAGLAAWHSYYRRHGNMEKCREIQTHVSQLPEYGRYWIKKLNYYQEV